MRLKQIGITLVKLGLALSAPLLFLLVYLDALIVEQFEGKRWSIPAKVYAKPLELYPGQTLNATLLEQELLALGYRSTTPLKSGRYVNNQGNVSLVSRGFTFSDGYEPSQWLNVNFSEDKIASIRNKVGDAVSLVRLEPRQIGGIYPNHLEDRVLIRLQEAPPYLLAALVGVEDRDFYQHSGLSFRGIARALLANIRAGRVTQGGSTLTQQLIKNFYLTNERTLYRKALEAVMALLLELHYDKNTILEAYLNEVYLGQAGNRAIHGFGLAARHYFGQPLKELDLAQVALLVALVRGPSFYHPLRHSQRAIQRRNLVIDLLQQARQIDANLAKTAKESSLNVITTKVVSLNPYPAYLDLVKRDLRADYQDGDLRSEGLKVMTHFDPQLQTMAEASLATVLQDLTSRFGSRIAGLQGAVIVSDTQSGVVRALVGGVDSRFAGFNRALDAQRPIGSLIKPAIYLTALGQPQRYTWASLIDDQPLSVPTPDGLVWQPANFDRKSHGPVTLLQALSASYNQATARLGLSVGLEAVANTVRNLGFERPIPKVPAMLLGAVAMSPIEVSQMYQTFASQGFYTPQRTLADVVDASGKPLTRYPLNVQQVFAPELMQVINSGLLYAMRNGTGRSAYQQLPLSKNLAGKTGTSNDLRDSWFAGFSQDLLIVVWLGRDDNQPTVLTGSQGALKVWTELVRRSNALSLALTPVDGVDYRWIDLKSGQFSSPLCNNAVYMPFLAGSTPGEVNTIDQPCP